MDQSTHEIRRNNWMNIINQCQNRPANMTAKQWLADNGISDKSYYYWLRKIRLEAYEQLNVPAVTQSTEVSFAEIPLPPSEDHSSDWNGSLFPNQQLSSNVETYPLDYPMIFQKSFCTDFLRRQQMLEDVAKIRRVVLACGMSIFEKELMVQQQSSEIDIIKTLLKKELYFSFAGDIPIV